MPARPSPHLAIENEIAFSETTPGYPLVHITNQHATATIALHGAHLISFTPTGGKNLIYTSPTAVFREGKAIRGGIPICWPWFSAHPTDPDLPSHGFARNRFWELTATASHTTHTELTFQLDTRDVPSELWQHHTTAELTLKIGNELTASLLTTNRSDHQITIGGALHTYLEIGDIEQSTLSGLENTPYIDTTNNSRHTQQGQLQIAGETDRIYHPATEPVTIHDQPNNRHLTIRKSGSQSTIIWNPWIEKSRNLTDLPDDAYRNFICVEAANTTRDTHTLQPGQTHTLRTTISTSDPDSHH